MLEFIYKNERWHSSTQACPAKWQGMKLLRLPKMHRKQESTPICPLLYSVSSTFPSFAIKLEVTDLQCNFSVLKQVRISFRLHALCAVLLRIIWLCAQQVPISSNSSDACACHSCGRHWFWVHLKMRCKTLSHWRLEDWETFVLVFLVCIACGKLLYDWIMGCGGFCWGIMSSSD